MSIFEDPAETKLIENRNRSMDGSTKGLRQFKDIYLDDLTYKALQHFEADGLRSFFEEKVLSLGDNILQSPLERVVYAFLLVSDFGMDVEPENVLTVLPGEQLPDLLRKEKSVAICPQHQVERFYLDFGVFINAGDHLLAFDFECDGVAYHGSNNAQIDHDFHRDVLISEKKFQIYRCSGADINRHPLYEIEKFSEEIRVQLECLRLAA